jgi:hypothetical protein
VWNGERAGRSVAPVERVTNVWLKERLRQGTRTRPGVDTFVRATALTAVAVVGIGLLGTLYQRGWGAVPFSEPSWPWYHSVPFYVFPEPALAPGWAAVALPVAAAAVAGVVTLYRAKVGLRVRAAATGGLMLVLTLAVNALREGPAAWFATFERGTEYPAGVDQVGAIPEFLRAFPDRIGDLPFHATGHPAGAMVLYKLLDEVWPGVVGATLLTVALGCLGAFVVAGLAADELGERGARLALVCWALSPQVLLYTTTSADAVFAVVLAGAVLCADRGLRRRSSAWTVAGGVCLWVGSMLTYAAVLVLPFLLVRAAGLLREARGWVLRWAALSAGTVLGLAGVLWLATGYDVIAAVGAVHDAYANASGSAKRPYLLWALGNPVAFGGMLGIPLLAAVVAKVASAVRERAWTSFPLAALAGLAAAATWGFSRGEVERIFLFLAPLFVIVAAGQLERWRVPVTVVAALLVAQTLIVEVLFFTVW